MGILDECDCDDCLCRLEEYVDSRRDGDRYGQALLEMGNVRVSGLRRAIDRRVRKAAMGFLSVSSCC